MNNVVNIFKTNGFYLGFIVGGNLFSRDGLYLGWHEGPIVWDSQGQYKGQLVEIGGNYFILKNLYAVPPIPRLPRIRPTAPILPQPPSNILPITPPLGYKDGF